MEINAYQPCPCHADRKIKFCCGKQIVGDLNEIMALSGANQTIAAIDKLDRVMSSVGEKDCLLTLKTHLLLSLSEVDKARQTNEQFLQRNPGHPMGLLHAALILVNNGELVQAIDTLQDAMDQIKGNSVPVSIGNAFRLLGLELLRRGRLFAARAHLRFARSLRPDDEQAEYLLRQSFSVPVVSTMYKHDMQLPLAPAEPEWSRTYQQVRRLAIGGRWRSAMKYIERKLLDQYPDEPILWRAVAVLSLWLGDARAIEACERLAQCPGVDMLDAAEAYAWSAVLSGQGATRTHPVENREIPLRDLNRALELLRAEPRMVETDDADEGSDALAEFAWLDQAPLASHETATLQNMPEVLTAVAVVAPGNLEPCLRFRWIDAPQRKEQLEFLIRLLGDAMDPAQQRSDHHGNISEEAFCLGWKWFNPPDMSPQTILQLEQQKAVHQACEYWTQIPLKLLGDRAPAEVAADPNWWPQLTALICQFAVRQQRHPYNRAVADALWNKLGVAPPATIDPREDDPKQMSPMKLIWVDWSQAHDEDLAECFYRAVGDRLDFLVEPLSRELLRREHLLERVPFQLVYGCMARVVADDAEALECMRRARKIAAASGMSLGMWLIAELELRLARGIEEKTVELINEIGSRHGDEPEVAARLSQILQSLGWSSDSESDPAGHRPSSDSIVSGESGAALMTASAGTVHPPTPETELASGTGRKLWLPGDP